MSLCICAYLSFCYYQLSNRYQWLSLQTPTEIKSFMGELFLLFGKQAKIWNLEIPIYLCPIVCLNKMSYWFRNTFSVGSKSIHQNCMFVWHWHDNNNMREFFGFVFDWNEIFQESFVTYNTIMSVCTPPSHGWVAFNSR